MITHFQLTYNLSVINVEKNSSGKESLYTLHFSNEIPSITLQLHTSPGGLKNWDSIPPGNITLASTMGKLIEQYYLDQGKDCSSDSDSDSTL